MAASSVEPNSPLLKMRQILAYSALRTRSPAWSPPVRVPAMQLPRSLHQSSSRDFQVTLLFDTEARRTRKKRGETLGFIPPCLGCPLRLCVDGQPRIPLPHSRSRSPLRPVAAKSKTISLGPITSIRFRSRVPSPPLRRVSACCRSVRTAACRGRPSGRSPSATSRRRRSSPGSDPPRSRPGRRRSVPRWIHGPSPPVMVLMPSTIARWIGRAAHQVHDRARHAVACPSRGDFGSFSGGALFDGWR